MNNTQPPSTEPSILFVDLDGTVVATDLLAEAFVILLGRQSRSLLQIPGWLSIGKACLKQALAERVTLDVERLPYRKEVVAFLTTQKESGRLLVLATASDQQWAQAVAESLGIFDDVIGSDGSRNLKGKHKLEAIRAYCGKHGALEFGYVGDSTADLPIWEAASEIYAVEPSRHLLRRLGAINRPVRVLGKRRPRWKSVIRAMRPHQWIKNILIFVPLFAAHQFSDRTALVNAFLAFIAFSLSASSVYVLNDVLDIEADRRHAVKQRRPFASGDLPVVYSLPLIIVLLFLGFLLPAMYLPWGFTALLGLYLIVTTSYSLWIKRKMLADVFTLAGLYTIRIIAGGIACGIEVSEWLLAFSMFMFTSLAFAKRYAELLSVEAESKALARRGYLASDLSLIESLGPAGGYMAVLILALYIHSPEVKVLYSRPQVLWLICPVIMYWISRIWFQAKRRILTNDPVVFAATDRASLLCAATTALLVFLAK
jgi:4-hydroxybenzoate polyprenyltransferase/phosphoserine phosphatase